MINKESFVQIMDALRDYTDALTIIQEDLGIQMDNNVFIHVLDKTLDALCDDMEPFFVGEREDPLIYRFAFDLDWGRNNSGIPDVTPREYLPHDAGELYDMLVEKQVTE